jgi:hypothetical protein
LLPPPGQVEITDLQEEKTQEKENGKKKVLAGMVPSPLAQIQAGSRLCCKKSQNSPL